ncbi:MAG: UDP-N-acetylmuramoyl-tripeptide--D-alanyl-D-alanine ligase [Terriglobales bacterium]
MQLSLAEIAHILDCPAPRAPGLARGYSIDSRSICPGEIFFALRGEQHDGHEYVLGAVGAGALGAVVEQTAFERFAAPYRDRLLPVPDPQLALQQLARIVRRRWGRKVIGITGSAGKTTTKEMVAAVLGTRYRVLKTEGNLNNHLGLPLTLLRLNSAHEVAVVEMGMNHAGEIAHLASIAAPQVGVVTNVGPVHLEFFGSLEAIAAAKRELIEALPSKGVAILNADDPLVAHFGDSFGGKVVLYGEGEPDLVKVPEFRVYRREGLNGRGFVVQAEGAGLSGHDVEPVTVDLKFLGAHNGSNALAALATGLVFGVGLQAGARALSSLMPASSRGEVFHLPWKGGEITLVDDCYNSNPPALRQMLRVLTSLPARRRVLVAGEMRELGPAAVLLHRQLGEEMAQSGVDAVFAVQGTAQEFVTGAQAAGYAGPVRFFADAAACRPELEAFLEAGDVILAKASRGVRLERAIEGLKEATSDGH